MVCAWNRGYNIRNMTLFEQTLYFQNLVHFVILSLKQYVVYK